MPKHERINGDVICQFCKQYMGDAKIEEWFVIGPWTSSIASCTFKDCVEKAKALHVERELTDA